MEPDIADWITWPVNIQGESFQSREDLLRGLSHLKLPESAVIELARLTEVPQPTLRVRTSGSTGEPKEMEFSLEQVLASVRATASALDLQPNMTALLAIDAAPVGGRMMLVRALHLGMPLTIVPAVSLPILPDTPDRFDFVALVPRQLEVMLVQSPQMFNRLGTVIIGGGPIAPAVEIEAARLPSRLFHTFAMTETLSHIALRKIGVAQDYVVLEGVNIEIGPFDELLLRCPWAGEPLLRTHDMVQITGPRSFRWLGRSDFVINSGGVKVHPEEVERFLTSFFLGRSIAIVGVPDAEWGQRPLLLVEGPGSISLDGIDFPQPAWRPVGAVVVEDLPRTENGKLARHRIRVPNISSNSPQT